MTMLTGVRRSLLGKQDWTPNRATADGYTPEHWYRSDGPLWQDAGTTAADADGDDVGRWEDKTSNADHVNQAVAANKPHLQNAAADVLNGWPVIRFDGTNHYLQGAFTTGGAMTQANTFFVVAKLDAAAVDDNSSRVMTDGDDGLARHLLFKTSGTAPDGWRLYCGANLDGGAADSNWNIWTVVVNGASSQVWQNGVSEVSGNPGAHDMDGLTIGSDFAAGNLWDGDMVELLFYDGGLSDPAKNQVGRYLAKRYSLSYTDI